MGHRGLGWATHQTISTSEDEDGRMACELTLIQEGLLDTGAVEAQTAGKGKGDLIAKESPPPLLVHIQSCHFLALIT